MDGNLMASDPLDFPPPRDCQAVAPAPRRSRREELLERKRLLHDRLEALKKVDAPEAEQAKVITALDVYKNWSGFVVLGIPARL